MPPQTRASMISSNACEKRSKCRGGIGRLSERPESRRTRPGRCRRSRHRVEDRAVGSRDPTGGRGTAAWRAAASAASTDRTARASPGRRSSRVAVVSRLTDRRDRAPEVPVVLVVPARDRAVGAGKVDHGEEPGLSAMSSCRVARSRRTRFQSAMARPARRSRPRLVGGARRADQRAELLDLVEVLGVGRARERVRPLRAELDGLSIRNGCSCRPRDRGRARGRAAPVGRQTPGVVPIDERERRRSPSPSRAASIAAAAASPTR